MYEIGDFIVYGSEGICRVIDIGNPGIQGAKERVYYTLLPVYGSGKIFTPVDSDVFMRPVMTCDEVHSLINKMPSIEAHLCDDASLQAKNNLYKTAFQEYDCANLISVIKSVYIRQESEAEKGKKLGQIDERFMNRAEDLIFGEFAIVLGMSKEEVKEYVAGKLQPAAVS